MKTWQKSSVLRSSKTEGRWPGHSLWSICWKPTQNKMWVAFDIYFAEHWTCCVQFNTSLVQPFLSRTHIGIVLQFDSIVFQFVCSRTQIESIFSIQFNSFPAGRSLEVLHATVFTVPGQLHLHCPHREGDNWLKATWKRTKTSWCDDDELWHEAWLLLVRENRSTFQPGVGREVGPQENSALWSAHSARNLAVFV